ncbi:MAG: acetamidase/formamidase family protein, partial [Chloroflexi bacterium]|nr:acetamidase/formamidase family protein [Chloroflexota bacterium]
MLHHFEPSLFYNTFGPHPPAFEIGDGDTLLTWTLDARGKDAQGHQRAQRGNPLTGPIYVREAAPGDTLEVTLEEIRPNRRYGFCGRYV